MFRKGTVVAVVLAAGCWLAAFVGCDNGSGPTPSSKPLEIVYPKGGESFKVGQTVTIKWKINDASQIGSVGISLSLDNGKSELPYDIEQPTSVFPPATTYSWIVTSDQVSNQCVMKVREYGDGSIYDKSGTFTISN